MSEQKTFPDDMRPLGDEPFTFLCHPGVSCFTVCCRDVDLDLYPYDIIRLKARLAIDSDSFMRMHTEVVRGANPYFPTVKLKLVEAGERRACPFLGPQGCRVYEDRPTACRTYPLERAVDRNVERGRTRDFYFLTNHPYCLGHREASTCTVKEWLRNQRLHEFNLMNDLWTEIDTLFGTNPFKGEGSGGPKQQLAFLVCYNIDGFRALADREGLLERESVERSRRRRIAASDAELLKFGFEWLKKILSTPV